MISPEERSLIKASCAALESQLLSGSAPKVAASNLSELAARLPRASILATEILARASILDTSFYQAEKILKSHWTASERRVAFSSDRTSNTAELLLPTTSSLLQNLNVQKSPAVASAVALEFCNILSRFQPGALHDGVASIRVNSKEEDIALPLIKRKSKSLKICLPGPMKAVNVNFTLSLQRLEQTVSLMIKKSTGEFQAVWRHQSTAVGEKNFVVPLDCFRISELHFFSTDGFVDVDCVKIEQARGLVESGLLDSCCSFFERASAVDQVRQVAFDGMLKLFETCSSVAVGLKCVAALLNTRGLNTENAFYAVKRVFKRAVETKCFVSSLPRVSLLYGSKIEKSRLPLNSASDHVVYVWKDRLPEEASVQSVTIVRRLKKDDPGGDPQLQLLVVNESDGLDVFVENKVPLVGPRVLKTQLEGRWLYSMESWAPAVPVEVVSRKGKRMSLGLLAGKGLPRIVSLPQSGGPGMLVENRSTVAARVKVNKCIPLAALSKTFAVSFHLEVPHSKLVSSDNKALASALAAAGIARSDEPVGCSLMLLKMMNLCKPLCEFPSVDGSKMAKPNPQREDVQRACAMFDSCAPAATPWGVELHSSTWKEFSRLFSAARLKESSVFLEVLKLFKSHLEYAEGLHREKLSDLGLATAVRSELADLLMTTLTEESTIGSAICEAFCAGFNVLFQGSARGFRFLTWIIENSLSCAIYLREYAISAMSCALGSGFALAVKQGELGDDVVSAFFSAAIKGMLLPVEGGDDSLQKAAEEMLCSWGVMLLALIRSSTEFGHLDSSLGLLDQFTRVVFCQTLAGLDRLNSDVKLTKSELASLYARDLNKLFDLVGLLIMFLLNMHTGTLPDLLLKIGKCILPRLLGMLRMIRGLNPSLKSLLCVDTTERALEDLEAIHLAQLAPVQAHRLAGLPNSPSTTLGWNLPSELKTSATVMICSSQVDSNVLCSAHAMATDSQYAEKRAAELQKEQRKNAAKGQDDNAEFLRMTCGMDSEEEEEEEGPAGGFQQFVLQRQSSSSLQRRKAAVPKKEPEMVTKNTFSALMGESVFVLPSHLYLGSSESEEEEEEEAAVSRKKTQSPSSLDFVTVKSKACFDSCSGVHSWKVKLTVKPDEVQWGIGLCGDSGFSWKEPVGSGGVELRADGGLFVLNSRKAISAAVRKREKARGVKRSKKRARSKRKNRGKHRDILDFVEEEESPVATEVSEEKVFCMPCLKPDPLMPALQTIFVVFTLDTNNGTLCIASEDGSDSQLLIGPVGSGAAYEDNLLWGVLGTVSPAVTIPVGASDYAAVCITPMGIGGGEVDTDRGTVELASSTICMTAGCIFHNSVILLAGVLAGRLIQGLPFDKQELELHALLSTPLFTGGVAVDARDDAAVSVRDMVESSCQGSLLDNEPDVVTSPETVFERKRATTAASSFLPIPKLARAVSLPEGPSVSASHRQRTANWSETQCQEVLEGLALGSRTPIVLGGFSDEDIAIYPIDIYKWLETLLPEPFFTRRQPKWPEVEYPFLAALLHHSGLWFESISAVISLEDSSGFSPEPSEGLQHLWRKVKHLRTILRHQHTHLTGCFASEETMMGRDAFDALLSNFKQRSLFLLSRASASSSLGIAARDFRSSKALLSALAERWQESPSVDVPRLPIPMLSRWKSADRSSTAPDPAFAVLRSQRSWKRHQERRDNLQRRRPRLRSVASEQFSGSVRQPPLCLDILASCLLYVKECAPATPTALQSVIEKRCSRAKDRALGFEVLTLLFEYTSTAVSQEIASLGFRRSLRTKSVDNEEESDVSHTHHYLKGLEGARPTLVRAVSRHFVSVLSKLVLLLPDSADVSPRLAITLLWSLALNYRPADESLLLNGRSFGVDTPFPPPWRSVQRLLSGARLELNDCAPSANRVLVFQCSMLWTVHLIKSFATRNSPALGSQEDNDLDEEEEEEEEKNTSYEGPLRLPKQLGDSLSVEFEEMVSILEKWEVHAVNGTYEEEECCTRGSYCDDAVPSSMIGISRIEELCFGALQMIVGILPRDPGGECFSLKNISAVFGTRKWLHLLLNLSRVGSPRIHRASLTILRGVLQGLSEFSGVGEWLEVQNCPTLGRDPIECYVSVHLSNIGSFLLRSRCLTAANKRAKLVSFFNTEWAIPPCSIVSPHGAGSGRIAAAKASESVAFVRSLLGCPATTMAASTALQCGIARLGGVFESDSCPDSAAVLGLGAIAVLGGWREVLRPGVQCCAKGLGAGRVVSVKGGRVDVCIPTGGMEYMTKTVNCSDATARDEVTLTPDMVELRVLRPLLVACLGWAGEPFRSSSESVGVINLRWVVRGLLLRAWWQSVQILPSSSAALSDPELIAALSDVATLDIPLHLDGGIEFVPQLEKLIVNGQSIVHEIQRGGIKLMGGKSSKKAHSVEVPVLRRMPSSSGSVKVEDTAVEEEKATASSDTTTSWSSRAKSGNVVFSKQENVANFLPPVSRESDSILLNTPASSATYTPVLGKQQDSSESVVEREAPLDFLFTSHSHAIFTAKEESAESEEVEMELLTEDEDGLSGLFSGTNIRQPSPRRVHSPAPSDAHPPAGLCVEVSSRNRCVLRGSLLVKGKRTRGIRHADVETGVSLIVDVSARSTLRRLGNVTSIATVGGKAVADNREAAARLVGRMIQLDSALCVLYCRDTCRVALKNMDPSKRLEFAQHLSRHPAMAIKLCLLTQLSCGTVGDLNVSPYAAEWRTILRECVDAEETGVLATTLFSSALKMLEDHCGHTHRHLKGTAHPMKWRTTKALNLEWKDQELYGVKEILLVVSPQSDLPRRCGVQVDLVKDAVSSFPLSLDVLKKGKVFKLDEIVPGRTQWCSSVSLKISAQPGEDTWGLDAYMVPLVTIQSTKSPQWSFWLLKLLLDSGFPRVYSALPLLLRYGALPYLNQKPSVLSLLRQLLAEPEKVPAEVDLSSLEALSSLVTRLTEEKKLPPGMDAFELLSNYSTVKRYRMKHGDDSISALPESVQRLWLKIGQNALSEGLGERASACFRLCTPPAVDLERLEKLRSSLVTESPIALVPAVPPPSVFLQDEEIRSGSIGMLSSICAQLVRPSATSIGRVFLRHASRLAVMESVHPLPIEGSSALCGRLSVPDVASMRVLVDSRTFDERSDVKVTISGETGDVATLTSFTSSPVFVTGATVEITIAFAGCCSIWGAAVSIEMAPSPSAALHQLRWGVPSFCIPLSPCEMEDEYPGLEFAEVEWTSAQLGCLLQWIERSSDLVSLVGDEASTVHAMSCLEFDIQLKPLENLTLASLVWRMALILGLNKEVSQFRTSITLPYPPELGLGFGALLSGVKQCVFLPLKKAWLSEGFSATEASAESVSISLDNQSAITASAEQTLEDSTTIFRQAFTQVVGRNYSWNQVWCRPLDDKHRLFHVSFDSERGSDYGGVFREGLERIVDDCFAPQLFSLFRLCPNGVHKVHSHMDDCVPNPAQTSDVALLMFQFVGKLIGASVRHGLSLPFRMAPLVWKKLSCEPVGMEDLRSMDSIAVQTLEAIRDCEADGVASDEAFAEAYAGLTFVTSGVGGETLVLKSSGDMLPVTFGNRQEYVASALKARLGQMDLQCTALLEGLWSVIPRSILQWYSWRQLEELACGKPGIDLGVLKAHTKYTGGFSAAHAAVIRFWGAMERLTDEERSLFVRFAWGRSRLPTAASKWSHQFKIGGSGGGDDRLPMAHTCFFEIELPEYSTEDIAYQRLRTVAHFGAAGVLNV